MSASADIRSMIESNKRLERRAMEAARRALDRAGEHVLGDAQQLAPIDSGDLKGSATSEPAEWNGNILTKKIGFNTDYAAAVHERLDVHHEEGQAKYLEIPIRRGAVKLQQYISDAVKKVLEP